MKHRDTHPTPVEGCFGCKLLEVQISTSSAGAAAVNMTEKRWERDMPAYYRLRQNGLQPKSIDGCAVLETRANDRFEVEMGHLVSNKEERNRAKEGLAIAREMNLGL